MLKTVLSCVVVSAGCSLALEDQPCPCAEGFACAEGICIRPEGFALQMDGVDDLVLLGLVQIDGHELTLESWYWPFEGTAELCQSGCKIISKTVSASADYIWMLDLTTDPDEDLAIRFRASWGKATDEIWFRDPAVVEQEWQHIAATHDGAVMRIYFNGELVSAQSAGGSFVDVASIQVGIGGNPEDPAERPWLGLLDETRIYRRALTPEEIASHYNGGLGQFGAPEEDLVAGFHFDEGEGAAATDYSGNGHDGALVNLEEINAWVPSVVARP